MTTRSPGNSITPIVRILHVSDVHFGPRTKTAPLYRFLIGSSLNRFSAPIAAKVLKGLSPHDPTAMTALETSLEQEATDPSWPGETLLVCTGDLATWGDDISLNHVCGVLAKVAKNASLPPPTILYGNHDVWPQKPWKIAGFPLFSNSSALDARRDQLRANQFPGTWPTVHARSAGATPKQLAFYSLNTIVHDKNRNWRALGHVSQDRYWQGRKAPAQHDELLNSLIQSGDIGVIFSHHPVHDQASWPHVATLGGTIPPLTHGLVNSQAVANCLASTNHHTHAINVVISGHVHEIVPAVNVMKLGGQSPLQNNQLQLCIGTAAQEAPPGISVEHSWQEVRFYLDGSDLLVERIVYLRNGGMGPFQAVAGNSSSSHIGEQVRIPL
jgi:Calcineurin-like phosphoesterase